MEAEIPDHTREFFCHTCTLTWTLQKGFRSLKLWENRAALQLKSCPERHRGSHVALNLIPHLENATWASDTVMSNGDEKEDEDDHEDDAADDDEEEESYNERFRMMPQS